MPASAVPKFTAPAHLVEDNFWSNLKQFLTERPIKVVARPGAPFTRNTFDTGSVGENLKEFLKSRPVPKGPINSRLAINWGSNFGGFFYRIREFISPTKLPPLQVTSKPIRVKEIWTKDENFPWTQAASIGLHGVVFALVLLIPLFWWHPRTEAAKPKQDVIAIDISPYITKLPAGANKAGGGGGANNHTVDPPNKGKLPKFQWTQFAAPQVKPPIAPKLAMDPSLLGPPDLKVANSSISIYGDPLAHAYSDSLGNGNGSGIGTGDGGGLGPGSGGGTGGGAFRAGVNGVGIPVCLYCPIPQYSDEARKAKYQGSVVLDVTITPDGRAIEVRIVKDPGLGLGEKAVEAVKGWKFKPAAGPSGKIIPVRVNIEVTFRLY